MPTPEQVAALFGPNEDTRVSLGTYLYPLRAIGLEPGWPIAGDIAAATEIVMVFPGVIAEDLQVHLTRLGGLFVAVRPELLTRRPELNDSPVNDRPWDAAANPRLDFQQLVVDAMNLVVCELALVGSESEPVSISDLASARMGTTRATIIAAGGPYMDRTMDPTVRLAPGGLLPPHTHTRETQVNRAGDLRRSSVLLAVAPTLPTFVAASYSLFARRLLAEALTDTWIAVELILNHLWKTQYYAGARDARHRKRLQDDRSFTANLKAELLFATGVLDGELYDVVQVVRKHRNDLMHGGAVHAAATLAGMRALQGMLALILGEGVAHPRMSWSGLF